MGADISDMVLFTGVQHLCTFNSHPLITFYKMFGRRIFVDVPYWLPYSTNKFISCVVPGPSQWFFHFGKEIVIAWTHIGWVWWMFQHLPLPACKKSVTAMVWLLALSWRQGSVPPSVVRCGTSGSMRACHAAGPGSIPGRDKFPGWGFFGGFSPVRQMSGSFRPQGPPNIIWPSLSSIIIHYGRQWPEMLTCPQTSNIPSVVIFFWVHSIMISLPKWKNTCKGPGTTQEMNLSML